MYRVLNLSFNTFEEVVKWAWNEHKIDANFLDQMDEEQMQQACEELTQMLSDLASKGDL